MCKTTFNCPICNVSFDLERKQPKELECGHALCSDCVDKSIINGALTCLLCNKKSKVTSTNQIKTSESMMRDMRQSSTKVVINNQAKIGPMIHDLFKRWQDGSCDNANLVSTSNSIVYSTRRRPKEAEATRDTDAQTTTRQKAANFSLIEDHKEQKENNYQESSKRREKNEDSGM